MSNEKDQIVDEKAMKKMSVAPPDPNDENKAANEKADKSRAEEELEQGLEETFPASDPPANVQPGHGEPMPSSGYSEDDTAKK